MKNFLKMFWPWGQKEETKDQLQSKDENLEVVEPVALEEIKYMAKCGHQTTKNFTLTAFGESKELSSRDINNIPYCKECLDVMTIQCACCGKPIFIQDLITLYSPDKDFKVPEYAVIYSKDPIKLVTCGRDDCVYGIEVCFDYCGHWIMPGKVERFPSSMETIIGTGKSVVGQSEANQVESLSF